MRLLRSIENFKSPTETTNNTNRPQIQNVSHQFNSGIY